MKNILVTGGAGYIGSHTIVELLNTGYDVIVADNLVNSSRESLARVKEITNKDIAFYETDLCDMSALEVLFTEHSIDAVIHFAGLKAVGESVDKPLQYYRSNLTSTLNLLTLMQKHGVKKLVFSSSATVYGDPEMLPLVESARKHATNPYGHTKLMIEQMLEDIAHTNDDWNITSLRYFNPIGAHDSGTIGEDPSGIPNNLLPFVSQVAVGKREKVSVFGGDYDTPDGTGVRDYIHVVDLARGHVAALEHMKPGTSVYNLGTGKGVSVLEIIRAFENACQKPIPYEIVVRRPGDVAACYADSSLAERELGWKAEKTLEDACIDSWRWQSQNPNGYSS